MEQLIKTENLTYIYNEGMPGEKTALEDVNVEINDGDFLGVIGHTGSGKSTLVQHFNALLRPTEGRVLVEGEDVWENKKRLREFRFKVGLVFQYPEYQLFGDTVLEDISFGPKNMGLSKAETERRAVEAAGFVGIDSALFSRSPFELSGGQKRRVAIAGVLAMEPRVLILDEPAAGLDPRGRAEILGEILEYRRKKGGAVVIISHSMEDVARFAEKVLVINQGRVFCCDSVKRVFARAAELEEMGLAIPASAQIMLRLRERGFGADASAFTPKQAAESVLSLLKGGAVC